MSKRIIILELTQNEGIIRFDKDLNKYVYLFQDWEEPYRSNIRKGDEFFVVNRTLDIPGIMMYGTIGSEVHYYRRQISATSYIVFERVILEDFHSINPEKYPLLSIDFLQAAMPKMNWGLGMPGWRIQGPYIRKFRKMWKQYLAMNDDFIDNPSAQFKWITNDN